MKELFVEKFNLRKKERKSAKNRMAAKKKKLFKPGLRFRVEIGHCQNFDKKK